MSLYIFSAFIFLLALQRLGEVFLSTHNEKAILARGGQEHAPGHFRAMKLMHLCWLIAMPLEVYVFERIFTWYLFIPALLITIIGQFLRYAAISTLRDRWTVRIMTIPNAPPVVGGIFRYIRHPNYTGVVLEILAVPLLHTAYLTALVFSLLNALVLYVRIGEEEKALAHENNYREYFR
jgi:methyltransferase